VTCEAVERDLDAYVDRELDVEADRAIRDHLNECVTCRHRVAERQTLGRLVRSVPYRSAPDNLRARIVGKTTRRLMTRRLATWAAAAALVIAIGSGATLVHFATARRNGIVDAVVDGHVRSLMSDHLFDVRSTDQHTVKPWFLGKLDFSPPVVDLASIGFPLIGGRLDYLDGQPAAAIVYQRRQHTINVFVARLEDTASTALEKRSIRGFHIHHWSRGGMSFWVVSDLNNDELTEFSQALERSS
jgi:anti-sigma factor RsiW